MCSRRLGLRATNVLANQLPFHRGSYLVLANLVIARGGRLLANQVREQGLSYPDLLIKGKTKGVSQPGMYFLFVT